MSLLVCYADEDRLETIGGHRQCERRHAGQPGRGRRGLLRSFAPPASLAMAGAARPAPCMRKGRKHPTNRHGSIQAAMALGACGKVVQGPKGGRRPRSGVIIMIGTRSARRWQTAASFCHCMCAESTDWWLRVLHMGKLPWEVRLCQGGPVCVSFQPCSVMFAAASVGSWAPRTVSFLISVRFVGIGIWFRQEAYVSCGMPASNMSYRCSVRQSTVVRFESVVWILP